MNLSMLLGIAATLLCVLPLAWKWQLGMRRVALFVTLTGAALSIALTLLAPVMPPSIAAAVTAMSTLAVAAAYLLYRFYRDPERSPASSIGSIVSPADGTIVYIKSSEQGQLPVATKRGKQYPVSELLKTSFYTSDVWVVGISMSLLDVHVNRSPISGLVTFQKHFPGRFGSLKLADREFDNERATTIIQNDELQLAIVQIASRLVRQIVSHVKVGDRLALGQRMGAIRLGSQVDLILPACADLRITAQVGARVWAGESVLATYNTQPSQGTQSFSSNESISGNILIPASGTEEASIGQFVSRFESGPRSNGN
jgi:phosphatidylserine decarboxylase